MLSPRIDAEGGNFRGLIIMAGSPRKLEEIMLDQNEAVLRSTKGFVHWIVKKQVAKISKLFEGLYEISDEEAKKRKMGGGTTLYYLFYTSPHELTTSWPGRCLFAGEVSVSNVCWTVTTFLVSGL